MNTERRADWKCQKCKPRKGSTSSNNSYHIIVDDYSLQANQKQQRDDENEENDEAKRFKNSLSLNDVNNSVYMVKADVKEFKTDVSSMKTDINDIKTTMQELAKTIIENNTQMNTNLQTAITTITNSITTLTSQVSELCESNKEKEKQINEMDKRINDLEQQLLNKNIEIKNVTNKNMHPNDVVKKIANSLNVEINDNDISNSYTIKKSQKVIVEFTSVNKKRELLTKINRHRVDSSLINEDTNNKFIYVNEHLTPYKRRLLWLAKTKAKDSNWRYVWIKNGNIYAKKNEISNPIIIFNASDIELIASTI
ncbi:putative leucine-rich repeat-containing protein DDB_G0290503 [Calliphora vicina]|uniref:putative leucine-rich repeat-containing protein DDB_G0290503 n=1 Tax=Calliphora vicina TaxID=7373 RepID=UPI00325B2B07